jgi:hypothetical protein
MSANMNNGNKDETDNIKVSQKVDVNDTPLTTPPPSLDGTHQNDNHNGQPAATPRKAKAKNTDDDNRGNNGSAGGGGPKDKWVKFEEEIDLSSNGGPIIEVITSQQYAYLYTRFRCVEVTLHRYIYIFSQKIKYSWYLYGRKKLIHYDKEKLEKLKTNTSETARR